MNNKIWRLAVLAVIALLTTCCEKTSLEDLEMDVEEFWATNNYRNIPVRDGVIVENGIVDLGLSVKWAACNLDESNPDHFASNCSKIGTTFFWSCIDSYFENHKENISGTVGDNATILLGKDWRTPTADEVMELIKKCRIVESTYKGVEGHTITGPSGRAIFLPNSNWLLTANARNVNFTNGKDWGFICWNLDYVKNTPRIEFRTGEDYILSKWPDFKNRFYLRPVYGPMK